MLPPSVGRSASFVFFPRIYPAHRLTMCSSGPWGEQVVFSEIVSAHGRLTQRWAALDMARRLRKGGAGPSGSAPLF